jgi:DNA (cytosine-5)-methyltransferase 1
MRQQSDEKPTALDLYCGVGGLSLGSIHAGFTPIGAVDLDQTALDAYRVNFPKVPVAKLDLRTATAADLRRDLGLSDTPIDLLIGGPPCQGFSVGGVGAKRDPRNKGVLAFARLVAELRPRYFVMENVRGFLAPKHAARRNNFCKLVKDAGYTVRLPIQALNAADYGVPQRRIRAFVLGHAGGEAAPEYPSPDDFAKPTVWDAIGDLSLLDRHCSDCDCDHYTGPFGVASDFAVGLRKRLSGRMVHRLSGCLRSRHSSAVVARFRATKPGDQEDVSRYYRLAWNGISPTLRAGTGPDHGSHTAPRPIHPGRARCITVREAARLHTFPDWFAFHGTKWHGFRQIGNSVPPYLAKAILSTIHKLLLQSR